MYDPEVPGKSMGDLLASWTQSWESCGSSTTKAPPHVVFDSSTMYKYTMMHSKGSVP